MKDGIWPWETLAMAGGPMPDGLPEADVYAYQSMRCLYEAWRTGRLTDEQAHAERIRIIRTWRQYSDRLAQLDRWLDRARRIRTAIRTAQTEFRKTGSPDAARRLSFALDGILI